LAFFLSSLVAKRICCRHHLLIWPQIALATKALPTSAYGGRKALTVRAIDHSEGALQRLAPAAVLQGAIAPVLAIFLLHAPRSGRAARSRSGLRPTGDRRC